MFVLTAKKLMAVMGVAFFFAVTTCGQIGLIAQTPPPWKPISGNQFNMN